MVIISNVSYPPESAKQIATRFMEAPQVPDFMTRQGPYVSANTVNGIFIVTVYELDNSNLAEGMDFLGNYLAIFFDYTLCNSVFSVGRNLVSAGF